MFHFERAKLVNVMPRLPMFTKKAAKTLAKLAVSVGTLYVVSRSISAGHIFSIFKSIQPGWLLVALFVFWSAQIISSLRSVYIARTLGGGLSLRAATRAHFMGLWFNQVFPTSLGGDVIKIALLKRDLGVALSVYTAILDRLSGLIFLLVSVLILLPGYYRLLGYSGLTIALAAFAFGALSLIVVLGRFGGALGRRFERYPFLPHVFRLFENIWQFRKGKPLLEQSWTSSIVHVNGILAYALIGQAIGVQTSWMVYFLITPLVFLVALLPVSFAGWGVREFGAVWLFGLVGISPESALSMSVIFGLLLIAAGLPGLLLTVVGRPVRS